jgi:hypothetical protein
MFPLEVMLGEIVAVLKWSHFSEVELANIARALSSPFFFEIVKKIQASKNSSEDFPFC